MFSLLAKKKDGEIDLDIGALRHQHERGRSFLENIEKSINGYAMGNEIAVTTLMENLAAYVSLLRRHIHIEDHCFFNMARKELNQDEQRVLMNQFIEEERKAECQKIKSKSQEMVEQMERIIHPSHR